MSMSRREIIEGILLVLIVVLAASAVLYWASPEEMRRIQNQNLGQPKITGSMFQDSTKVANTLRNSKPPLPLGGLNSEEYMRGVFPHEAGNIDSSISPGETNRHEIIINDPTKAVIACFSDTKLRLVLINPDGVSIDSFTTSDGIGIYYSNPETTKGRFAAYAFFTKNIPSGKWIVEITNDNKSGSRANYNIGMYY